MNEVLNQILNYVNVYMLILARCIGLFIASPVFGRKNLPNIFKLGFSVILAYIVLPFIDSSNFEYMTFLQILFLAIKELMIGLVIGFIAFIVFSSFFMTGSFIDRELGFSMANVVDPQYGFQVPITGNLIYIIATLIFLIVDGHHYLIKALINSFYIVPINNEIILNSNILKFTIDIFNYIFVMAIKISIPITIIILSTNLILGILARTMPQMNVFVVGMPIKVILGLLILSIVFPYYEPIMETIFKDMYKFIFNITKILQG
ncbi:MAG: flagellar biosynthetic protein FliR [Tepidibacter sp.]|jgi:flagellar biosynthetic protein FliR|uniref:flagellar biosynthetic protein FliR n=1 Tax=Tepidibacter sp. TaxID=2529387 RepID=UPI0025D25AC4|nr:flagellar biosynthetic protein FliR [Tepidibacter sp.]MCT4507984.1 flagellar biosynthetic protein FliR [Tepidibacter sp.]